MSNSLPTLEDFTANNVVEFPDTLIGGEKAHGPITGGGGGSGMSEGERISRLETHFEYIRKDLDEIKSDQRQVLDSIKNMPTKGDLREWKWTWTAIALAAVAVIVGGIIGGLSWIKGETNPTYASPPPLVLLATTPAIRYPVMTSAQTADGKRNVEQPQDHGGTGSTQRLPQQNHQSTQRSDP